MRLPRRFGLAVFPGRAHHQIHSCVVAAVIPPMAGGCTQLAGTLLESTRASNCVRWQALLSRQLMTCVQPPAIGGIAHGGLGFNDPPMDDKTIATMNDAEFDALVDRFIERGEDQVTPQTLLQVWRMSPNSAPNTKWNCRGASSMARSSSIFLPRCAIRRFPASKPRSLPKRSAQVRQRRPLRPVRLCEPPAAAELLRTLQARRKG